MSVWRGVPREGSLASEHIAEAFPGRPFSCHPRPIQNSTRTSEPRSPLWIRAAGVGAVALFIGLVIRFWNPVFGFTSFLLLDQSSTPAKIAAVSEQPVYIYPYPGEYDGQFYAQLAHHPLLNSDELREAMDNFPYRARRILPAALAWLLAGGNPAWIFDAYSVLNILAWFALAWILWRLLRVRDLPTWVAWAGVLFSAGAMISVRRALTDLVALAFIAGSMLVLRRGRNVGAALALGAAGLCRETSLLAAAGFTLDPSPGAGRRRPAFAISLLVAVLPLAAWLIYVWIQAGPEVAGVHNFTWPLLGFLGKWKEAFSDSQYYSDAPMAAAAALALVGLTVQALHLCLHRDWNDPWWRIGAAYLLMMAVLGPAVWQGTPSAAFRILLPMTLAFNLVASARKAPMFWLVLGNLPVALGVWSFRDLPPTDPLVLYAARSLEMAGIVRQGSGWYGQEHSARHVWMWAPERGRLDIEVWPRTRPHVSVRMALMSVIPRRIKITEDGVACWNGTIGPTASPLTVVAALTNGRARLDFSTDSPPVRGTPAGDIRILSFAVYDPKIIPGPDAGTGP